MTDASTIPERAVADRLGRPLRDLRLSVTDRCNLRCTYCMPEADYEWLPRAELLDFDELTSLVDAFTAVGVEKVRITGGEPLLRRDLPELIARIAALPAIDDLALTTNGTLLAGAASALRAAGLGRVTISLDTLDPARHHALTGRDNHADVLAGIEATAAAGFTGTKINTVVLRGTNDDELADLVRFGAEHGAEVRFIEYMDVGGATRWDRSLVVPAVEVLDRLADGLGQIADATSRPSAPARRYRTADGTTFGIVASTTTPFCGSCDRSRVTADGRWYRCLYAVEGTDLRAPIRAGASPGELRDLLASVWSDRTDQGAVDRLALAEARTATPVEVTRRDPHREMHTRGG
ncbi:MAG: GTP 3',8-cyclase MoaA [Actinobacteria bacterium]|nr:GTP 3',8-cyclase MoaA [Actinomycetota bacterium]